MVGFVADYAVMGELNSGRNARKESKSNSSTCANGIRAFRQTFTHIMSLTFTTINDCRFTSRAQGQLIRGQNWCRVHILTHCSYRSASCGVDGSLMNQARTEMQGYRLTFGTGCTGAPNLFFCRCTSTKFWCLFIRCIVSVNSTSIAPECECASSCTWCFLEKIKRRSVNRGRIGQRNCCLWWRSWDTMCSLQLADRFAGGALNQTGANVPELACLSFPPLFPRCPSSHTHLLVQRQANPAHCLFASSRFIPSTLSIRKPPPTPFPRFPHYITLSTPNIQAPVQEASAHAFIISDQKKLHFLLLLSA